MNQADGSAATFSQSALEHIDALYRYAMVLTHDQTEAEDLVQETYLRAMKAFGQLLPDSNLKRWLFVIMRNAWLNHVRHSQTGPRFVKLENEQENAPRWPASLAHNPDVVYLRKLESEKIKQAIESLPGIYREIVVLRDIEGFSYQEIAAMLGCPAGTVMSRLGRARQKLRRMLASWRTSKAASAV